MTPRPNATAGGAGWIRQSGRSWMEQNPLNAGSARVAWTDWRLQGKSKEPQRCKLRVEEVPRN